MNTYEIINDIGHMSIYSPKYGTIKALIDPEDIPRIKMFNWVICQGYVTAKIGSRITGTAFGISLHRLITSFEHKIVDHINRNPLDNRKINLRGVSASQNTRNKFVKKRFLPYGVYCVKRNGKIKYSAQIRHNNKLYHFGTFLNPKDAFSQVYLNYPTIVGEDMPSDLFPEFFSTQNASCETKKDHQNI